MSSYWFGWQDWLYPELARFPDDASRRAAGLEFQKQARNLFNWRFFVPVILAIPFGLLMMKFVGFIQIRLPFGPHILGVVISGALIGLAQGALIATFINWSYRKPLQRFLREKLNSLGIPTCVHCGYDTRGLTVPRCPECGRPFATGATTATSKNSSSGF